MQIGDVARLAGVGVETVRFYERKALIRQPDKPLSGGYRDYPDDAVTTIRFIRQAQELGFSLKEIAELQAIRTDPEGDCEIMQRRASEKLMEVKSKIARLQKIGAALQDVISSCPSQGSLDTCPIIAAMDSQMGSQSCV